MSCDQWLKVYHIFIGSAESMTTQLTLVNVSPNIPTLIYIFHGDIEDTCTFFKFANFFKLEILSTAMPSTLYLLE